MNPEAEGVCLYVRYIWHKVTRLSLDICTYDVYFAHQFIQQCLFVLPLSIKLPLLFLQCLQSPLLIALLLQQQQLLQLLLLSILSERNSMYERKKRLCVIESQWPLWRDLPIYCLATNGKNALTSLALFLWMRSLFSLWYCSILSFVFSTSILFVRLYTAWPNHKPQLTSIQEPNNSCCAEKHIFLAKLAQASQNAKEFQSQQTCLARIQDKKHIKWGSRHADFSI